MIDKKTKKVLFTATIDGHILSFHLPYLKMFKDKGYEVHVATNGDKEIPYCDVKHIIPFERSPFKLNNVKAIKQLKKIIENEKFDTIHCHTPMGGVVTRLAAKNVRKNGTRVIYTAHGFHFYKGSPVINWLIFYPIEKWLSKYTDTLITINEEDYNLAKKKFYTGKIELIHGVGVDKDKFNFEIIEKEKDSLRKTIGVDKNDFVMICVGELNDNKNQIMQIEAMREIIKEKNNVKLLLAGKGEKKEFLEKKIKEYGLQNNVIFLGYRNDVPRLLKISNLVLSTSKREGLPVNVIEALMSNIPVIGTNCRGTRDLIQDGVNGYIVEINDVKDLFNKVVNIKKMSFLLNDEYVLNKVAIQMNNIYFGNESKKLLFVHGEEKLKEDTKGNYYTDGSYSPEVWERYEKISNDITVIFRKDKKIYSVEESKMKFQAFDKMKYKFVQIIDNVDSIKSFLSIKIKKNNTNIIKTQVKEADYIIARVPTATSYIAVKYAKLFKKKYLVEVVGCPFDSLWNHSFKGKILSINSYVKLKQCLLKADYVTYVSTAFLQKRYKTKGKQLSCSDVVLKEIKQEDLIFRLEKIKKMNYNDIILGSVGATNVKYKGQQYVIKSIAKLKKEGINLKYKICGGGDQSYLKKVAQKYGVSNEVEFLGSLSHDRVFDFMREIDIYIQPSNAESHGRVIIEAMSVACPVIGSSTGGIPELIPQHKLVFKRKKVNSLIDTLKYIITQNFTNIAQENFESAKQFSMKVLNKKREEFYKEFCDGD